MSLKKHVPCALNPAKVHEYRCANDRVSERLGEPALFYCIFCLTIVPANVVLVP